VAPAQVGSKGAVTHLFLCRKRHEPMTPAPQAKAVLGHGLEGDWHTKRRVDAPNQVLVMDSDTLRALGMKPGELREQVTVDLPGLHALTAGSLLRVGPIVLQVSGHCVPCAHMAGMLGLADAEAFKASVQRRRGMLCSVVSVEGDGWVRVGDAVEVVSVETEEAAVLEEARIKAPYR
jgi:hypothetical protein